MSDWRFWLAEQRGTLLALGIFVVMFTIYSSNHPAGLHRQRRADRRQQGRAARVRRDGADAGGDHRRHRPVGRHDLHPDQLPGLVDRRRRRLRDRARRRSACLRPGLPAARSTARSSSSAGCSRSSPRSPPARSIFGIALLLRPFPGGSVNEDLADALTGRLFGVVPASLVALLARRAGDLGAVQPLGDRPRRLCRRARRKSRPTCRACRSGARKFVAYTLSGLLAAIGGLFLTFFTYTGEAAFASGNAYTLFSIAAVVLGGVSLFGGKGSAIGAIFGALAFRTIGDLLFVFDFDPLWQPLFQGVVLLIAVSLGAFAPVPGAQPAGVVPMSDAHDRIAGRRLPSFLRRVDPAVATAFACIVLLLLLGSLYSTQLPVAGISAAAAQGGVVPRRHRHRHDAGHPARPDRPVGAMGRWRSARMMACAAAAYGPARRGPGDPVRHPLRRG